MINHVRTLLLNRSADDMLDGLGGAYIEPGFSPLTLPESLKQVKAVLYPRNLDSSGDNYVTNLLMNLLHAPEFQDTMALFDPRITYNIRQSDSVPFVDVPLTVDIHRSSDCDVEFSYAIQQANIPKTLTYAGFNSWTITKFDEQRINIAHNGGEPRVVKVFNTLDPTRGKDVEVIADYLSFRFGLPSSTLTGDFTAYYTTVLPVPYTDLINKVDQLDAVIMRLGDQFLFKHDGFMDDELTLYKRLWNSSNNVTIRIGAVLAAIATKTESLRLRRG